MRQEICHLGGNEYKEQDSQDKISVYETLRVDAGQSTCGLANEVQLINVRMPTQIVEDVPVAIKLCCNGGNDIFVQGYGRLPSGGYVLMVNRRPDFLKHL